MTLDLDALEKLARAATRGPWKAQFPNPTSVLTPKVMTAVGGILLETMHYGRMNADAAFVAAANPEAVLLLLQRIKNAEAMQRAALDGGRRNEAAAKAAEARVEELETQLKVSDARFQERCKAVDEQFGWQMEQRGRAEKAEAELARVKAAHAEEAGKWDEQHARQHAVNIRMAQELARVTAERDRYREALEHYAGMSDMMNGTARAALDGSAETDTEEKP